MKISGVIDPDFEFSTLWMLPLAESIPAFCSKVICPWGDEQGERKISAKNDTQNKQELPYHIGVVSCFTLFPLLMFPLYELCDKNKDTPSWVVRNFVCYPSFFCYALVVLLTALPAAVLTLLAIVPIAIARGGYEFFKQDGLLDQCKTSIADTFKLKSN